MKCGKCGREFGTHTQLIEHRDTCSMSLSELLEHLLTAEYGSEDWRATGSLDRITREITAAALREAAREVS